MNAMQLNVELFRAMGEIADDETLMSRVVKFVKKLAAKKKADPTLMTKDEFFAMLDRSEEDYRQGRVHEIQPDEDLTAFLKRVGYEI